MNGLPLRVGLSRRGVVIESKKKGGKKREKEISVEKEKQEKKNKTENQSKERIRLTSVPLLLVGLDKFFKHESKKNPISNQENGPFGNVFTVLKHFSLAHQILTNPAKFCSQSEFDDRSYRRDEHMNIVMQEMGKVLNYLSPWDLDRASKYLKGELQPETNGDGKIIDVPLIFCRMKSFLEKESQKQEMPLTDDGPFGKASDVIQFFLKCISILLSPENYCSPARTSFESETYNRDNHYNDFFVSLVELLDYLNPFDLAEAGKLISEK